MGHWALDSSRLVIQVCCETSLFDLVIPYLSAGKTSASHLVLVKVERAKTAPYDSSDLGPGISKRFQCGPGEALPLTGYHLILEGVVDIHGGLILYGISVDYESTPNP